MSTSHPDLLNLRGHFIDPHLSNKGTTPQPVYFIADIFPLDDEQAVIFTTTRVALINIRTQEIHWSIASRPAYVAALDRDRSLLSLITQDSLAIWDLQNGQLLHNLDSRKAAATDIAFSVDGTLLAVADYNNGVQIWQIADKQANYMCETPEEDYGCRKSIAFSPDSQYLACGNYEDDKVCLWNTTNGQLVRVMATPPHAERVHGLAFSSDGKLLVAGDIGGGQKVASTHVWDVQTGKLVQEFEQKTWLPTFSNDGQLLASTVINQQKSVPHSYSDPIYLWDVNSRNLLRQFRGHKERILHLVFSPSKRMLISCSQDRTASWWDVESGQEVYRLETAASTRASGAFSADGKRFASGEKSGRLHSWRVENGELITSIWNFPGGQGQEGIAFNSDGTRIASWTQTSLFPGELCLWSADEKGRPLHQLRAQKWIFCAAFSPDSTLVAAGCDEQTIRIWDIASKSNIRTFKEQIGTISCLAFSPNNRLLASGSSDPRICLWDVQAGGAPQLLSGHSQEVTSVAFSLDGTLLASGSVDQTLYLWDVASQQLLRRFQGAKGAVCCLVFSSDGTRLAVGDVDNNIYIWSVANGQLQSTYDASTQVKQRAFALDGSPLATNVQQESVWIWEFSPEMGHYHIEQPHIQITSMAFKTDDTLLVSGYCDGSTQSWRFLQV